MGCAVYSYGVPVVALQEQVQSDLKEAMRLGQAERRDALRLLLAAFKNEQIALGHPLSDDEAQAVIRRLAKRHRESIEEFRRGQREDLVAREQAQLAVVQSYLPLQMSTDEIAARARAAIEETGAHSRKDMGRVMGRLADLRGKADMAEVSRIVQSLLSE